MIDWGPGPPIGFLIVIGVVFISWALWFLF